MKIAAELDSALARRAAGGFPGSDSARRICEGDGWMVSDVICTRGPRDRAFEESHSRYSIAVVAAGSFQYRGAVKHGRSAELMTPGSLLLGNPGQRFECGHEHRAGDRCIAFQYSAELFETFCSEGGGRPAFEQLRLPPLHALAPVVARAFAALASEKSGRHSWEELSVEMAASAVAAASHRPQRWFEPAAAAVSRVTAAVRRIDEHPDASHALPELAREARLSRFHFLRAFERVTGLTPHRYVLRARLREAAVRLADAPDRVVEIAFDCGFGDVSNFNHAFRAEFGVSPRAYRRRWLEISRS